MDVTVLAIFAPAELTMPVIPAQAGIQYLIQILNPWIPALAGMTKGARARAA
jgi:hypothetical protein